VQLLLDTYTFIWALAEPHRLPEHARAAIEDSANDVFISAAVTWEIAIKHALGKLPLPMPPAVYVPSRIKHFGFKELPISVGHTLALSVLPLHHADPFDRILVAQAQSEQMTLVSVDPAVRAYAVSVLHT
jgi:PIN domain nuclease of toxin-antitoxin system